MAEISDLQKKMYENGRKVEEYFIELAERDGFKCLRANNYQDRYEHWDVLLIKDDKSARVDVKGYKDAHQSGFTWIEFQTVDGEIGWIRGKAHAIAFEREDCFELYNRKELKKFIEKKIVNPTGYVFIKPNNLQEISYHRYRRMGRKDILVVVPFNDIEQFLLTKIMK